MGFWSTLGTIGSIAAAPFTGGTSLAWLPAALGAAGQVGNVLGKASGGKQDANQAQAVNDATLNNQRLNSYNTQQNAQMNQGQLDLQRKQFDENSEAARLKRALVGSLLGNMQDFNISMPGIPQAQVSGGLKPSSLGQGGRDAAAEMVARALSQVRSGNQYQGGNILQAPTLQAPTRIDSGTGFLDTAALIASLGGALGAGMKDYTKINVPPTDARNRVYDEDNAYA